MRAITASRGFTIIEVIVALTLVGALGMLILPMMASSTESAARAESERRLRDLRQTLLSAYRMNAFEIDGEATDRIVVAGTEVLTNGTAATETTFAWAERYAAMSTSLIYKDGFGVPFRIFVSNRIAETLNGSTLHNHKIAIVSAGRNGRVDDGTTFDPTTGQLTMKGDDIGEVIDGFQVQKELFDTTRRRIQKISDAYQSYFLARYQSNESRNLNLNYFANGPRLGSDGSMFDTDGSVGSSGGVEASAETLLGGSLGFASNDFKDGYGNPILVDNSSDAVRTPDNSNAAMASPPYTVIVKAALPSGESFAQAIVGAY